MNKLTADTARSLIARMKENESNVGLTIRDGYMMQALEIALPVLEQQGWWISCSEQMPAKDGGYLTWDGRNVSNTPFFFGNWQANQFIARNITHWQAMPLPPITTPSTTHQIDNDAWVDWDGGECPVADSAVVRVRYRGEFQADTCIAGNMIWNHSGEEEDIIAYRVIENDGREG